MALGLCQDNTRVGWRVWRAISAVGNRVQLERAKCITLRHPLCGRMCMLSVLGNY